MLIILEMQAILDTRNHLKHKDMKSYYVFIRNYGHMCPGSFVYYVSVGTSEREQTKLALLTEYCRDCGFYLKLRDAQTLLALNMAKKPFCHGELTFKNPFVMASVSVSELYNMIIDDSLDLYEANYHSTPAAIQMNHYDDPRWVISYNRKKCNTACQPHKRKNLSDRVQYDSRFVAVAISIILVVLCAHTLFKSVCINCFGAI